jgi:hypothetical protein
LKAKPLFGPPPKFDWKSFAWIYGAVTESPLQMKSKFALWTREIVSVVIKRKFGIRLSPTSAPPEHDP